MFQISASLVKELREKSGAGMMDCKKALIETSGNIEEAIDWLRKKGLAAASKKAGRIAAEGVVVVNSLNLHEACMVEVNSETDFVARNPDFQEFARRVTNVCLANGHLCTEPLSSHKDLALELTQMIATIGENIHLRREVCLQMNPGVIATYVHGAVAPNMGRIGVLVALSSTGDSQKLLDFGKKIAMHIAAASPLSLSVDELDPTVLEREKNILIDQAKASNRPQDVVDKMVEGRVRKFYEEVVLLEQMFIMDNKIKVSQAVSNFANELGAPVSIASFVKFNLGEGIDKEQKDFAAEVNAQLGL